MTDAVPQVVAVEVTIEQELRAHIPCASVAIVMKLLKLSVKVLVPDPDNWMYERPEREGLVKVAVSGV